MSVFLLWLKRQPYYQPHLAAPALTMSTNSCHVTKKQNGPYLANSSISTPPTDRYLLTLRCIAWLLKRQRSKMILGRGIERFRNTDVKTPKAPKCGEIRRAKADEGTDSGGFRVKWQIGG
ncbi:hypothetical protein L218DRAFT_1009777 [Marasmius fiardii PR-910]|nr:hypothetical protein L218DRAFT_1009777 [Marasmius fiardii PR-910]